MNNIDEVNKTGLISALYARVSTGRQEQEATIDSQIAEIKKRIGEEGNLIPAENIFVDDGWTGEMLRRPALDAMRDGAQAGNFELLYVYDRGRLSRVFAYQEIIIEELADKCIKFVTLHDIKAETPEEKVLQAMQGVFHEYERVKIAERMRRGKLYKARNGILINGHALYGLDYIKKTDKEPAHCEINQNEAKVVELIWEWFGIERLSINQIIKQLFDRGIQPKKGRSQFWTKGPIVRILQCESYVAGVVYYNKTESIVAKNPIKNEIYKKVKRTSRRMRSREEWIPFAVPKIIEDYTLYEKIQKILYENKKYAHKNRKYDYLLSGRVVCECGCPRAGDGCSKNGHYYYRCTERIYNHYSERRCTSQGVNAAILDGLVWRELGKYLTEPSLLKKYAESWLKEQAENQELLQEKEKIKELFIKALDEEKRYAKAYGEKMIEFEQFKELMKDVKNRKEALKKQLTDLTAESSSVINEVSLDEFMEEVGYTLKNFDLSDKIKVIRDIIDKVIIKERNGVEVWAHIPLATHKLGYEPISRDCWFTECG